MALEASLLVAALVALPIFIYTYLYDWLKQRMRMTKICKNIPGPPTVPVFGSTHLFKLDKVEFSYQLEAFSEQYGTNGAFIMWIGPNPLIVLSRAQTAEAVLQSNSLITKSNNYDILVPWLGTGLLISTGAKWKSRRKMLTPTFHFSILNHFIDIFGEQASILKNELSVKAQSGCSFDLFPFIGRCALDIICETAMGVQINAQLDKNSDYVRAVQTVSDVIFKHERMPWLWLKPIWYAVGYGFTYDRCLKLLKGFTQKVITDRSASLHKSAAEKGVTVAQLDTDEDVSGKTRRAFLDLLLMLQEDNNLTFDDIAEEVDTFMFEGHDTTASGMGWTLWSLGHNPDIQEKLYDEMTEIFDVKLIVGDSDRQPTPDDLKEMRYLDRVVKEGLRLFPPVPLFARTVTEDFVAGDYKIPKGSTTMVLPFMIHRDPNIYGPDPDKFDPDRFLPENSVGRHPYAYVPFSAGPRNCIGQKFALLEEKVILSTVIRNFKIESLEGKEKMRPVPDVILRPPERFLVRLTARNASTTT